MTRLAVKVRYIPVFGVHRNAAGPISAAAAGSGLVEQACNYDAYRGAQIFYNVIPLCKTITLDRYGIL